MSRQGSTGLQNFSISGQLETTPEFYNSPHGVATGLLNVLVSTFEPEVRVVHRFVSVYLAKADVQEKLYFIVNLTSSASLDNPIYAKILSGQCEELAGVSVKPGHSALQSFFFRWNFDVEIQKLFDSIFRKRISLSNVSFYKKYLHKCFIEQLTLVRKDDLNQSSIISKLAQISGFSGLGQNGQSVLLHILSQINGPKTTMETLNKFFAKSVDLQTFNDKLSNLLALYYNSITNSGNTGDIRQTKEWQTAKEAGIVSLVRLLEKTVPPHKATLRKAQTQGVVSNKGYGTGRPDQTSSKEFGARAPLARYEDNESDNEYKNRDFSSPSKFVKSKTLRVPKVNEPPLRRSRNNISSYNDVSNGNLSARKPKRQQLDQEQEQEQEAEDLDDQSSSPFTVNRRHREGSQTSFQESYRGKSRDSPAREYSRVQKLEDAEVGYYNDGENDVYGKRAPKSLLQLKTVEDSNTNSNDYTGIRDQQSHRSGRRGTVYKSNPYR